MIKRYANPKIAQIFSDENKLELWQETELAVIGAMEDFQFIRTGIFEEIGEILRMFPIDLEWWEKRDEEIHHDLNAFLDERLRHLNAKYHKFFHKNITSYDTEEPAFGRMLTEATDVIMALTNDLEETLINLAIKYRYTIMNARTHGQEAELQSFGARCLTWLVELRMAKVSLDHSAINLSYSKLSGAIGKYGSLDPRVEERALDFLGFSPFYGATQIMPRILYAPLGQSLCNMVSVLSKIGLDIRLGARSGRPILQEPFKKKQKGSSAMPHKKNTIRTEQLAGMATMARGYMMMISENIVTWEERAIEQSSVERVAWPDLFHVTAHALKVISGVLKELTVYTDNMLLEVHESRGVYASSEVKEWLKTHLGNSGLTHEDIYRIVQIAGFNVFEPEQEMMLIRETNCGSTQEALGLLRRIGPASDKRKVVSIEKFIPQAKLRVSSSLDISQDQVDVYNEALKKLFKNKQLKKSWKELFTPGFLLKNEDTLYKNILEI